MQQFKDENRYNEVLPFNHNVVRLKDFSVRYPLKLRDPNGHIVDQEITDLEEEFE